VNEAAAAPTWLFIVTLPIRRSFQPIAPRPESVVVVAVRLQVVRVEVAVVVPVSVNEAVPVPAEVMAAVMECEPAPHTGTQSADVDAAGSAWAPKTDSADMNSTKSARAADADSAGMGHPQSADVTSESTASKPTRVAAAKSTAAMATAAAATATARIRRGCSDASGERAGEQNDHRFLQHLPIPIAWPPTWLAAIAIGTMWCDRVSAVFWFCRLLCTLAAIWRPPRGS
jgi:hypothetical protein